MKKAILTASAAAFALAASAGYAAARDQIQIVGSSTVFPFTTAVAEKLGQGGQFKTPVVESTGTGGGMKLFCGGVGENTPDFTNASRAIKDSELEDLQGQRRHPGRDQDRLRRHRARQLQGRRGRRPDQGADLQGARQERRRRRQGRRQPVHELVGHRRLAAGHQDRGARPAADLRHARRLRRTGHGRGLPGRSQGRQREGLRRNPRGRRLSSKPARTTT